MLAHGPSTAERTLSLVENWRDASEAVVAAAASLAAARASEREAGTGGDPSQAEWRDAAVPARWRSEAWYAAGHLATAGGRVHREDGARAADAAAAPASSSLSGDGAMMPVAAATHSRSCAGPAQRAAASGMEMSSLPPEAPQSSASAAAGTMVVSRTLVLPMPPCITSSNANHWTPPRLPAAAMAAAGPESPKAPPPPPWRRLPACPSSSSSSARFASASILATVRRTPALTEPPWSAKERPPRVSSFACSGARIASCGYSPAARAAEMTAPLEELKLALSGPVDSSWALVTTPACSSSRRSWRRMPPTMRITEGERNQRRQKPNPPPVLSALE
mmetsp:Transcript_21650/g.82381  ORF Transcript_21650/g.82381 Transcript_21650/m.82381 type:complete len:335 (-) Transcript_21650:1777-2781(-)